MKGLDKSRSARATRWRLLQPPVAASKRARHLAAAGALGPVLIIAACSSHGRPATGVSRPAVSLPGPTGSPPLSGATAVQAAVAAYTRMWMAYNSAVQIPDPSSTDLRKYASGDALQTLVKGLQSVKDRGLKGTGQIVVAPQVDAISPASAPIKVGVRDCLNDGATRLVRLGPGSPYQDTPGGRHLCTATVELQADGQWRVTQYGLRDVGTC